MGAVEDDEERELLVRRETVLCARRHEERHSLCERGRGVLDLEHAAPLEHDVDLVLFVWLLAVRLGSDEHVDPDLESGRAVHDLVAATPGNERLEQKQAVYTRGGTAAEIHITAEDRAGVGHAVVVSVFGPCVQTDGPDSDEVTSLEGTN